MVASAGAPFSPVTRLMVVSIASMKAELDIRIASDRSAVSVLGLPTDVERGLSRARCGAQFGAGGTASLTQTQWHLLRARRRPMASSRLALVPPSPHLLAYNRLMLLTSCCCSSSPDDLGSAQHVSPWHGSPNSATSCTLLLCCLSSSLLHSATL